MVLEPVQATAGKDDADASVKEDDVSPRSRELVIGLVGYAGAGFTKVSRRLSALLETHGYTTFLIKLSGLIHEQKPDHVGEARDGESEGEYKFRRSTALQNLGDELRSKHEKSAVASLAIRKIIEHRGGGKHGQKKLAFILDSIKHPDEVGLLRRVYDKSFRLLAIYAEREVRLKRLAGDSGSTVKYAGVDPLEIEAFLDRDEEDIENKRGQQVRKTFYLADFFLNNNGQEPASSPGAFSDDLERFLSLILGSDLIRPLDNEIGMYFAHVASLESSCLSRQVGAAIQTEDGRLVATGTNEVPKFGGGVYQGENAGAIIHH